MPPHRKARRFLFAGVLLVILAVWPVLYLQLSRPEQSPSVSQMWLFGHPAFAARIAGGPAGIADVAERAVANVVNIATDRGGGSGVIVSGDGLVVTNNHVIKGARRVSVTTSDGREFSAKLVGSDRSSDLAVLRLKGKLAGLEPMPVGDSNALRLGEVVLAIGNPLGVGQTVTMGIVSAKDRNGFVQTDAAINPGNSGGALVNMKGELVGIATFILSRSGGSQGLGFAIPSNTVDPIIDELLDNGQSAWLGVTIRTVNRQLAAQLDLGSHAGVLITGVMQGSPADRGGIEPYDIVVAAGKSKVSSVEDLKAAIKRAGVGKRIHMEILRGEETKRVRIALIAREDSDSGQIRQRPSISNRAAAPVAGLQIAKLDRRTRRVYSIRRDLRGVVVTSVQSGSEASFAGLQEGDVIVEVNRMRIRDRRTFARASRKSPRRLLLLVDRDGEQTYVALQP